MFEKASRDKLRFETPKGFLTAEDLWDLPLSSKTGKANLDDLAKGLNQRIQHQNITSFVSETAAADATVQLGFDIVLHIIKVRLAENKAANDRVVANEKKQQIMAIIERKETESLAGSSIEELRAMLGSL